MEPDLIPVHESRFQRSRLQPHPTSSMSVPLLENWMPQLVTDSSSKPNALQTPRKMLPKKTQPSPHKANHAAQRIPVKYHLGLDVKTCPTKHISSQSKTDAYVHESESIRKSRNVIEGERLLKKEVSSKVGLPAKQEKCLSLDVGKEADHETNNVYSSYLPHYMKPLNRSVANQTGVVEQTKGKVLTQPSVRKKTVNKMSPANTQVQEKQLNSKSDFVALPFSQVSAITEAGHSVNVNHRWKAPNLKPPPCSPASQKSKHELGVAESGTYNNPISNESNELKRRDNVKFDKGKEILVPTEPKVSRPKEVPLSQTEEDIDHCKIIEVNIAKTKKKTNSLKPKRVPYVTKHPSVCTPLKSRPKTKVIQNQPYRGAVADPLKGELPPNGNLQCKPDGMKNFITTVGMPFYGLPVSQTPQYSGTYLDMLDEAGITLRKAIKESVKMANKKLQDPKPWMPSRFACPPRKRPVSPDKFTRRPRSPETMIWRLAKEDIIIDRNSNSRITVPPDEGKTPRKKSQAPGIKKKTACNEHMTRGEGFTEQKADNNIADSDFPEVTISSTQQTAAARILALMEKSAVPEKCSCDAARRIDNLVTQNLRLRQEVRQLERRVIEKSHANKLREQSLVDINRNTS